MEHFVDHPVENVEDQESEGEGSSGDGVDALGPLHVAPPEHFSFSQEGGWHRWAVDGAFHGCPTFHVLQTMPQSIALEVEAALFFLGRGREE